MPGTDAKLWAESRGSDDPGGGAMILGISGLYAAGKGEVVAFLEGRSFSAYSLSDVIRDELKSRQLDESRELMIATGRALRESEGAGLIPCTAAPRPGSPPTSPGSGPGFTVLG